MNRLLTQKGAMLIVTGSRSAVAQLIDVSRRYAHSLKRCHYILILGALLAVVFVILLAPRIVFLSGLIEHLYPGITPASSYARNLYSTDPDLVRESFYPLTKRKSPVAVPRAIELLNSPDDYIWLNAAIYLGACNRQEAVPYLIKALRHTAWRSDAETALYLRTITGADFGTDFARWRQWWLTSYPDFRFDWDSHLGYSPRITKTQ